MFQYEKVLAGSPGATFSMLATVQAMPVDFSTSIIETSHNTSEDFKEPAMLPHNLLPQLSSVHDFPQLQQSHAQTHSHVRYNSVIVSIDHFHISAIQINYFIPKDCMEATDDSS